MVLYEPTPTKNTIGDWYRRKWMEKHWPEISKKLEECGFEFYESTLWEDLKKLDEEKYKDYRPWFVKLLDGLFDLLSTDVVDLFRRNND